MACPEGHLEHASRLLADNWAMAHTLMNPKCPGIKVIVCDDHFHIGHASKKDKRTCVAGGTNRGGLV